MYLFHIKVSSYRYFNEENDICLVSSKQEYSNKFSTKEENFMQE
jgi:hypothetical protein